MGREGLWEEGLGWDGLWEAGLWGGMVFRWRMCVRDGLREGLGTGDLWEGLRGGRDFARAAPSRLPLPRASSPPGVPFSLQLVVRPTP